jgi:hypothetical protein
MVMFGKSVVFCFIVFQFFSLSLANVVPTDSTPSSANAGGTESTMVPVTGVTNATNTPPAPGNLFQGTDVTTYTGSSYTGTETSTMNSVNSSETNKPPQWLLDQLPSNSTGATETTPLNTETKTPDITQTTPVTGMPPGNLVDLSVTGATETTPLNTETKTPEITQTTPLIGIPPIVPGNLEDQPVEPIATGQPEMTQSTQTTPIMNITVSPAALEVGPDLQNTMVNNWTTENYKLNQTTENVTYL